MLAGEAHHALRTSVRLQRANHRAHLDDLGPRSKNDEIFLRRHELLPSRGPCANMRLTCRTTSPARVLSTSEARHGKDESSNLSHNSCSGPELPESYIPTFARCTVLLHQSPIHGSFAPQSFASSPDPRKP